MTARVKQAIEDSICEDRKVWLSSWNDDDYRVLMDECEFWGQDKGNDYHVGYTEFWGHDEETGSNWRIVLEDEE